MTVIYVAGVRNRGALVGCVLCVARFDAKNAVRRRGMVAVFISRRRSRLLLMTKDASARVTSRHGYPVNSGDICR